MRVITAALVVMTATMSFSAAVLAAPELVTNGNFEQTTLTSSAQFRGSSVTGWTNATTGGLTGYGYNFLAFPGTADTTGFTTLLGLRNYLDGPRGSVLNLNRSDNGLPATSPASGNYLIASTDAATGGAVSQLITGLTAGQSYSLSFYWAAAQFAGTLAATTERWSVSFGQDTQSTAVASQPVGGFTPWAQQFMTFTATSDRQVLSFLAVGGPNGVPSAGLLDGVSLMAAPEPASWALMLVGLAAAARWRTRRPRGHDMVAGRVLRG